MNTFRKIIKDSNKDFIEVEVGDTKQPDFKPQIKIKRWNNEVNFSVRAEEEAGATVVDEGGVIKYKTTDYEVHQYDKPEEGEDGGTEFEWVLKNNPASNVLTTTIQSKDLDFFYQPGLKKVWKVGDNHEGRTVGTVKNTVVKDTDGKIIASRPANIVGSYAVYHKTKTGNNDSREYKTGKAFHIYRPRCVDADGNKRWANININESTGILKVTINRNWLNNAKYPVVVDPTFGFTSIGGSSTNSSFIRFSLFTLSEIANVTSMSYYIDESTADQDTSSCIYDDDAVGNEAGTLIANSSATAGITGADWRTSTLIHNGLAAGDWWLGHWQESARDVYYDTSGGPGGSVGGTFNTYPDPAGTLDTNDDNKYSIYATYTEAATTTSTSTSTSSSTTTTSTSTTTSTTTTSSSTTTSTTTTSTSTTTSTTTTTSSTSSSTTSTSTTTSTTTSSSTTSTSTTTSSTTSTTTSTTSTSTTTTTTSTSTSSTTTTTSTTTTSTSTTTTLSSNQVDDVILEWTLTANTTTSTTTTTTTTSSTSTSTTTTSSSTTTTSTTSTSTTTSTTTTSTSTTTTSTSSSTTTTTTTSTTTTTTLATNFIPSIDIVWEGIDVTPSR